MKISKALIQATLPLVMAILLFTYTYRDFHLSNFTTQLKHINLYWILLSMVLSLGSHLLRAYRWKLLLHTLDVYPSVISTFKALLIGYLTNLLVPRLGEFVRCSVLKNYTHIPTSSSLGTVVAERLLDLLSLLLVLGFTLCLTFEHLQKLSYATFLLHINSKVLYIFMGITFFFLIILTIGVVFVRQRFSKKYYIWLSILKKIFQSLWQGIISIHISNKKLAMLFLTMVMWMAYYLASYVGLLAIPETANMSLSAGLAILFMSSLSLTVPVQGGIGAYHLLVSSIIIAYGSSRDSAMLYVTIMHSSQILMTFLAGGISFISDLLTPTKKVTTVVN